MKVVMQALNWESKNALNYVLNERTKISTSKNPNKNYPIRDGPSDKRLTCEKVD